MSTENDNNLSSFSGSMLQRLEASAQVERDVNRVTDGGEDLEKSLAKYRKFIGSIVAVLDNPYDDDHYHIAKVIETNDSMTTLWYACTKGSVLKHAVWKFLYRHKSNGVLRYQYRTSNNFNRDNRQFIAKLNTADLVSDPPYIVQTGIRITNCSSGFKIDTRSTRSLKRTASFPYRHHVLNKSWSLPLGED